MVNVDGRRVKEMSKMTEGRHGGFGLCCLAGQIYVVGGYRQVVVPECERYSIKRDAWSGVPTLPDHCSLDISVCPIK